MSACGSASDTMAISARWVSSRLTGSAWKPDTMSSSTCGHCGRNTPMAGISQSKQVWHSTAKRSWPASPWIICMRSRSAEATRGSSSRPSLSRRSPAGVKRSGVDLRSNSSVPKWFSSTRIWCDRADCVKNTRCAAKDTLPVSSKASSVRKWRSSIMLSIKIRAMNNVCQL